MSDIAANAGVLRTGAAPQNDRIVGFWGRRWPLIGLLLKNSLLGFLTAGVYRFWARTRVRQYFWRSIEIDGDPLEYTGRGLELFIGFLIVIAVLVPLSMGYSIVSLFLDTAAPAVSDAVNFLYFIFILWLTRYAYFRARRYRLARTMWRGIRAGQDGSASGYAWLWFGYAVLSVITLGWAVPWLTAELQKYEVEKARFGVENFRYQGTGSKLFRPWFPCCALWSLGIVFAVGLTITNFEELRLIFQSLQDFTLDMLETEDADVISAIMAEASANSLRLLEIYGLVIVSFIVSIPFYFIYQISALRYMFNVSNLSDVGFTAKFSAWRIVGNWFLYVLVLIVTFSAVFALIGGITALGASGVEDEVFDENIDTISTVLTIVIVIAFLMVMPIIKFIFFHYPVIRHASTTLAVSNIVSLERIVQSSKDDPRFGEGLASALDFDVGGF